MRKRKKSMLALAIITAFIATALLLPGLVSAGDLEPSAAPGPTMKTLDEIPPTWSQKLDASERFELVLDGEAILDKETGLVWSKNANLIGPLSLTWLQAMPQVRIYSIGGRNGWRLPTVEELSSLIDSVPAEGEPALPIGHPFEHVQLGYYWSSTTDEGNSTYAWVVDMSDGNLATYNKTNTCCVWPVRGGN